MGVQERNFLEGAPLVSVLPRPGATGGRSTERRRGPGLAGRCGATAQLVGVTDEVAVVGAQVVAEAEGGRPVTLAGLTLAGGFAV